MKQGWPILRALTLGASLLTAFNMSAHFTNDPDPFLTLNQPVVTNGEVQFTLTGEARVPYFIESSGDTQNWKPVATNTDGGITRLIVLPQPETNTFYRALRQPLPVFASALAARYNIIMKGNKIRFDSFDSADPMHDNPLDPTGVKDGGDVASGEGIVDIGNAEIKGKVKTGLQATLSLGPQGSVGSLSWNASGSIQPGYWETNYRFAFPDVKPPYDTGISPVPDQPGTNYWELDGFDYFFDGDVDLYNTNLLVAGNARLHVTGSFLMRGSSFLRIRPGATLQLFVGGGTGQLQQFNNAPSNTLAFQYYGLVGNTNFAWSGNSNYVGTIYAPRANTIFGGGGLSPFNFYGACVARSAEINGHVNFHFDENLQRVGPMR